MSFQCKDCGRAEHPGSCAPVRDAGPYREPGELLPSQELKLIREMREVILMLRTHLQDNCAGECEAWKRSAYLLDKTDGYL